MAVKDTYHDAVKNALIKDGWTITADPYPIKYEEIKLLTDLAGEKTIYATREGQQIVIEIKSFLSRSPMREFETALGQYLIYQTFDNERDQYLWFQVGWTPEERIKGISVHIRLKNKKIYIEEDWTEEGIANKLLREGVPKEDIVLAFHDPETRKLTELAIA
ncbi:MAG: hypothetical protein F6K10_04420 [Moorea sp. SIO2B7]|nr:hypothetical protein [Moorena sp. SIO2B7]